MKHFNFKLTLATFVLMASLSSSALAGMTRNPTGADGSQAFGHLCDREKTAQVVRTAQKLIQQKSAKNPITRSGKS